MRSYGTDSVSTDSCGGCVAADALTPRMCGVGDAITTGTNADTGMNPDREYNIEIAARPRRPYHAFVSSCS